MGAMKRWYEDCACRGIVPVSEECVDGLHCLRDDEGMPWIEVIDGGEDGPTISMATARRLIAVGAADQEITQFVECFGGMCPAAPGCCPICGGDSVTFLVEASFWDGRLSIQNAGEPEGPTYRGVARCEDCETAVDATPPEWTRAMRDDAETAYAAPKLRDALAALHRAATEAGVTGPAVGAAAATLRSIGCEVAREGAH